MPKRLVLPWLLACAVFLGLLGLAPAARSDTLWWIAAGGNDRASDAMNWSTHPIHGHRLPGGDLNVYVTTADHHGIRPGELAAWPRLSGGDLTTGNFYVGGWPESLRADFGDPEGQYGLLRLEEGSLQSAERPGNPPCGYLRVGYNGADGSVEQTGGSYSSCTFISLGFWRATGFGSFDLEGGEVSAYGFDTGVMGSGRVQQVGGDVDVRVHQVGHGYTLGGEFTPGSGFFRLGGGTHSVFLLRLGSRSGAAGLASIQRGVLSATAVEIGSEGSGALVQSGGLIVANRVVVGHQAGGIGQLTVAGGELRIAGRLSVGDEAGGRGRTTVTPRGELTTRQLTVHDGSSLQFLGDAHGAGRIVATGPVEFREDARIDIRVAVTNDAEPEPTVALELGQRLVLIEASRVSGEPRLAEAAAADWRLDVHDRGIDAVYYPCQLRCDLDHDGLIGMSDLRLLRSADGIEADCDGDGRATPLDLVTFYAAYGRRCED